MWGLRVVVVGIFGCVGRHWSQNTPIPLFFYPPKPLLTMECLAHKLTWACKGGVQSMKSDDGEVDTELTSQNMQKFITWTKKSQRAWDISGMHIFTVG